MQISKYLIGLISGIAILFSSCTYDYVYDIHRGNNVKNFTIKDDGFHYMVLSILEEYGASIVYHQREQTIEQYDKDGQLLQGGKYDLARDYYISAPGTAYIVVKVAMNAGKMGYICTDPIELKPVGVNEITLDANTPVHVELDVPEESLPTRYIITQNKNIENVLLPIAKANGQSGYMASLYVHEFNANNEEVKKTNVKQSMLGELLIASEKTHYFIIEIALYKTNGIYFGSVEVDAVYNITPHKLLKVHLDNNVKVKASQFSSGSGIVIL